MISLNIRNNMIFLLTFKELDTRMSANYIICLFAEINLILNGNINSRLSLWVNLQSKTIFPYIILHFWHQRNNTHLNWSHIQIFDFGFTVNAPVFLLQDEKNQQMTTNVWMKQASLTVGKLFFKKQHSLCCCCGDNLQLTSESGESSQRLHTQF